MREEAWRCWERWEREVPEKERDMRYFPRFKSPLSCTLVIRSKDAEKGEVGMRWKESVCPVRYSSLAAENRTQTAVEGC